MAPLPLTDTHCHLYMERFDADLPAVVARAQMAGVDCMLVPGIDAGTSRRAMELANQFDALYCAIGFHPTEVASLSTPALHELHRAPLANKLVAIGEIGLDYYWVSDLAARGRQRAALEEQLNIARAWELPAILHLREHDDAENAEATRDLLAILRSWTAELKSESSPLQGRAGVLHSFSGSLDAARQAIELGFYLGVTGPITYPKSERRRLLVQQLPLERILIETDSPFLAPQQQRGQRNEPAFVTHIADRIADIQSQTPTEVAEATRRNAARLFDWREPD